MEDSIYKKYGIDPNRIPTDAEVELVAFCFDVNFEEAWSILSHRRLREDTPIGSFVHEKQRKSLTVNSIHQKGIKRS